MAFLRRTIPQQPRPIPPRRPSMVLTPAVAYYGIGLGFVLHHSISGRYLYSQEWPPLTMVDSIILSSLWPLFAVALHYELKTKH